MKIIDGHAYESKPPPLCSLTLSLIVTFSKIAEDGEILIKGENVMLGYWNLKEETKKVIKDGKINSANVPLANERTISPAEFWVTLKSKLNCILSASSAIITLEVTRNLLNSKFCAVFVLNIPESGQVSFDDDKIVNDMKNRKVLSS